jgi:hypothetical protein
MERPLSGHSLSQRRNPWLRRGRPPRAGALGSGRTPPALARRRSVNYSLAPRGCTLWQCGRSPPPPPTLGATKAHGFQPELVGHAVNRDWHGFAPRLWTRRKPVQLNEGEGLAAVDRRGPEQQPLGAMHKVQGLALCSLSMAFASTAPAARPSLGLQRVERSRGWEEAPSGLGFQCTKQ